MKRIGPWLFGSGIVVLCAGIVSTRSDAWIKPRVDAIDIPLDTEGVGSVVISPGDLGTVVITDRPPGIHIDPYEWTRTTEDMAHVTVDRNGDRLRIEHEPGKSVSGDVELAIPPGIATLSGSRLEVKAEVNAGNLKMAGTSLNWDGDAGTLDMQALPGTIDLRRGCQNGASVYFEDGSVQVLRISIESGQLVLGNLSRVDRIEIHAGAEVQLTVSRIEDLRRIEMRPFDGTTTTSAGISPLHNCSYTEAGI